MGSIVIVGNGEVPAEAAARIDAADLVVRFNDCRSAAERGRTDVVAVCNTGRPARAMLASPQWRNLAAVRAAAQIWSVRDPEKFVQMRAPLAISHPELDDFCDDYTKGFADFAELAGKDHIIIGRQVHEAVDAALDAYAPPAYVVPSSGMVVIAHVLTAFAGAEVAIAGFGHQGWEWHPFAAEKRLVDSYVASGRLSRLQDAGAPAASVLAGPQ